MHESVNVIVDAYLQRNDHNVLALEWSELAAGNYLIDAVPNAKQVFYHYFIIMRRETKTNHNIFNNRVWCGCVSDFDRMF